MNFSAYSDRKYMLEYTTNVISSKSKTELNIDKICCNFCSTLPILF